ncbi:hypothetical protein ACERZ8_17790 [Tateyamaria armeniaca]|uniref:DUF995 domain-containing protein n=1 Tax=Tateyamaria armeniaca TaxID=2518930 RepID=A0ABW8UXS8_9RHOB
MRRFALILALCAPESAAADWVALSGAEIRAALEGQKLVYANATQEFRASGKTLYTTNGRDSWGNWRIEDDQYCSQWPPSDLWACYGLERADAALRFVGDADDITEATYAD